MIHSTVVPTHQYRQFMSDITKQYLAFAHSIEHFGTLYSVESSASWRMVRLSNEGQLFVPNVSNMTLTVAEQYRDTLSDVGAGIAISAHAYYHFYLNAMKRHDLVEADRLLLLYQRLMSFSMERDEHDAIVRFLTVLS